MLCNEATLAVDALGAVEITGSATEAALLVAARSGGIDAPALRGRHPLLAMSPRAEGQNWMGSMHAHDGQRLVAVKGAPDEVRSGYRPGARLPGRRRRRGGGPADPGGEDGDSAACTGLTDGGECVTLSGQYTPEVGQPMTRVQILLTDEQDRQLEKLARRLGTSKARLVREGVEFVLQRRKAGTPDALLDLVGQAGRVGRNDIAAQHDRYLVRTRRVRSR